MSGGGAAPEEIAGAPNFDAGGAATAGSAPAFLGGSSGAGAAGTAQAGSGVAGAPGKPPLPDYGWAAWPMPNAASAGLPNPASYDVSIAGVVTDQVTGLMWQAVPLTMALPWMETKVGCEMLVLGGHDDWRLPTRIELVSLLSFESESMTDSRAFPFQSPPEKHYWSASPYAADPSMQVWLVSGFGTQTGYATTAGGQHAARCVRSTRPLPPQPHYLPGPGVVLDKWTGLVWEREPPAYWQSLDEVSAYCRDLELGGRDDWYLPSVKELGTLVDEKRAYPALDPELFPGTEETLNGWFWSSTRYPETAPLPHAAPGLRFSDGIAASQDTDTSLLPRCVRQGS